MKAHQMEPFAYTQRLNRCTFAILVIKAVQVALETSLINVEVVSLVITSTKISATQLAPQSFP